MYNYNNIKIKYIELFFKNIIRYLNSRKKNILRKSAHKNPAQAEKIFFLCAVLDFHLASSATNRQSWVNDRFKTRKIWFSRDLGFTQNTKQKIPSSQSIDHCEGNCSFQKVKQVKTKNRSLKVNKR